MIRYEQNNTIRYDNACRVLEMTCSQLRLLDVAKEKISKAKYKPISAVSEFCKVSPVATVW